MTTLESFDKSNVARLLYLSQLTFSFGQIGICLHLSKTHNRICYHSKGVTQTMMIALAILPSTTPSKPIIAKIIIKWNASLDPYLSYTIDVCARIIIVPGFVKTAPIAIVLSLTPDLTRPKRNNYGPGSKVMLAHINLPKEERHYQDKHR